ncbi:MAG TPA: hypothetical protein VIY70_06765 [Acidimicrobiia bacterium]
MRWSISLRADGDRPLEREEIVELADAVASLDGIASGIGTNSYSAQIVIEAPTPDEAVDLAIEAFTAAAARAGLPSWPVAWAESIGDEEEFEEFA